MTSSPERVAADCLAALLADPQWRRATVYLSPTQTVKATRQRRLDRRDRSETFIVSVGRPNHRERKFIALCKKAKQSFPVKKVVLTRWAVKKAKKKAR